LASPQHHPFWSFLLHRLRSEKIVRPGRWEEVLDITGPGFIQQCVEIWAGGNISGVPFSTKDGFTPLILLDHCDLVVWTRRAVCPYHASQFTYERFQKAKYPKAYAAHHWFGSWIEGR